MEVVMQNLANQLVQNLAPMFVSMMVIVLVLGILLAKVRNRAIRQLGGYVAAIVWVGWLVNYYKVA
ncbi:MAG: hypothetical protein WBI91_03565 [Coriobacteriia bacterium]